MTRDRTRTMVLRNSRSIQKHRTGCELLYCDMRETGCAFAWRSHVKKSCLPWDISDVTSCNALTSRRLSLWRHVFTSRSPAIRHRHVKKTYFKLDFKVIVIITNVCVIRRHRAQHSSGCRWLVNFSLPPLYWQISGHCEGRTLERV